MQLVESGEVQSNGSAIDEIRDLKSQLRQLTRKMTQMQTLVQKVGSLQNKPQVNLDLPSDTAEGRLVKEAFPLKCYEKMQLVEEQLESNDNFYNEMVKHFDIICGSSIGVAGIGTGKKYSYILCDHFFDRQFLTSFTWTGSTRLEQPKRSMRDFKQILISFLRIINSSDATFNMIDLEEFFKCVLKNSRKRAESSESMNRRMSAPKMKKKKNNDLNELDGYAFEIHAAMKHEEEII
uniref:Uncharacterized protein n=1 Tax=Phlebotomus papatasi TaxID=29031 RepID=A0A1B0D920_PHLPP